MSEQPKKLSLQEAMIERLKAKNKRKQNVRLAYKEHKRNN